MCKKIFIIFLALAAGVGTMFADKYVQLGALYYNLNDETKTAKVAKLDYDYLGSISIPKSVTYNTVPYSVTSIGNDAFLGCSGLTSVTIPNSVTSIGDGAFYECTGLTSVTIPNNVTSIGDGAFYECIGLTSIIIPENIQSTGKAPFGGCNNLQSVIWNAISCTTYDDGEYVYPPFQNCPNITSFTIGNKVKTLPRGLCYGLPITSIDIPGSVNSIGVSAFRECEDLTSVTIPNNCSQLTSVLISDVATWCNIKFNNYSATPLYYAL